MDHMGFLGEEKRKPNTLQIWGNAMTMNLNNMFLTNIVNSPYYKGHLSELKTYHEVVDEIYYKVKHLEPWEAGSRKTSGQTGMCGGVRGVGAGGIVSTAFCLLYKLFTLKLTRKQLNGLLKHRDSPYIRGLGFMYVRYTQPPSDLWDWFEEYLEDDEEIDVRAGTGQVMTIGEMVRLFLTKLDWYSSLFPRIPVPIQIGIDKKMTALKHATSIEMASKSKGVTEASGSGGSKVRLDHSSRSGGQGGSSSRPRRSRTPSRSRSRSTERKRRRERNDEADSPSRKDRSRQDSSRNRKHSRSRSRSPRRSSHHHHSHREDNSYHRRDRDHNR